MENWLSMIGFMSLFAIRKRNGLETMMEMAYVRFTAIPKRDSEQDFGIFSGHSEGLTNTALINMSPCTNGHTI